jgi:hypothetical protein
MKVSMILTRPRKAKYIGPYSGSCNKMTIGQTYEVKPCYCGGKSHGLVLIEGQDQYPLWAELEFIGETIEDIFNSEMNNGNT